MSVLVWPVWPGSATEVVITHKYLLGHHIHGGVWPEKKSGDLMSLSCVMSLGLECLKGGLVLLILHVEKSMECMVFVMYRQRIWTECTLSHTEGTVFISGRSRVSDYRYKYSTSLTRKRESIGSKQWASSYYVMLSHMCCDSWMAWIRTGKGKPMVALPPAFSLGWNKYLAWSGSVISRKTL